MVEVPVSPLLFRRLVFGGSCFGPSCTVGTVFLILWVQKYGTVIVVRVADAVDEPLPSSLQWDLLVLSSSDAKNCVLKPDDEHDLRMVRMSFRHFSCAVRRSCLFVWGFPVIVSSQQL